MNQVQTLFNKLSACGPAKEWAKGQTDLESAWINCKRSDWMIWLLRELKFKDAKFYRLYACWCVRNTPIENGKVVWDLLTDIRSKNAVEVAENYIAGFATIEELRIAKNDANAAANAAYAADAYAADAANAAADAVYADAYAADAAYAANAAADAVYADAAANAAYAAANAAADAAANAVYAANAYAADARLFAKKVQSDYIKTQISFETVKNLIVNRCNND